jgi:hypothetical protein
VGDDSHFVFRQKLLSDDGIVRRGVVMVMQPGLFSPKGKGKVRGWGLYSTEALWLIVLLTPKGVPSFISRGAAPAAYSDLS